MVEYHRACDRSWHLTRDAGPQHPALFPDPDRLDITRTPNRHASFAVGIHFCLGAPLPLARLEGQIAMATLLRCLPQMELATDTLEWRGNIVLRGLKELPVRISG